MKGNFGNFFTSPLEDMVSGKFVIVPHKAHSYIDAKGSVSRWQ